MLIALVLLPLVAGCIALLIKNTTFLRFWLILTAGIHLGLVILCWVFPPPIQTFYNWFELDSLGLLFLSTGSLLFFMIAIYIVGEFKSREKNSSDKGGTEAIFMACLLFVLSTMTIVTISQHFGALWVAMEAMTLATAPLISFYKSSHALEATWKYLLLCSIGIALALLGNIFLSLTAVGLTHLDPLLLSTWLNPLPLLNNQWLKLAFIFYLVGYGTKMGLAPLHSWLPDTYSEAPSGVTALMSSALINCAVLALLRVQQVFIAQGLAGFTRELFIIFGISSLAVASFFILGQKDYKRLLAYSSIEHMGILALSIGLGGVAITGGLLHIINHSLIKGILFMTAGNIIACYKTRETAKVAGIIKLAPFTGVLWFAGFLAITGTPPFGLFISKFMILKAALEQGQFGISIAFLAILATIFIGMSASWLQMSFGNWTHNTSALGTATLPTTKNPKEYFLTLLPGAILCIFAILLGLYIPPALSEMIQSAASLLGGTK